MERQGGPGTSWGTPGTPQGRPGPQGPPKDPRTPQDPQKQANEQPAAHIQSTWHKKWPGGMRGAIKPDLAMGTESVIRIALDVNIFQNVLVLLYFVCFCSRLMIYKET